jgi:hypothetical protein
MLTKSDTIGCGLSINPECHPRHDHKKDTRKIDLDEEIASMSLKVKCCL